MKHEFLVLSAALIAMSFGSGCNNQYSAAASATCSNCSAITPQNFVSSLVSLAQSGQINSAYANSTLTKAASLQPGTFVIWDGASQTYMAITIQASCTPGEAGCANSNPQAAALGFANANITTHYQVVGGVNSPNGTYYAGSFGTYTVSSSDYAGGGFTEGAGNVSGINLVATGQTDAVGNPIFTDVFGDGELYSQSSGTRDTDLQQANLQRNAFVQRAATISAGLQMDFQKAVQLTTLSDKLTTIANQGQAMTDNDRAAMMQSLSGIAGVTTDDLSNAITQQMQGNSQPTSDLVDTIAKNLGMPSSIALKNKILPQLGIDLN